MMPRIPDPTASLRSLLTEVLPLAREILAELRLANRLKIVELRREFGEARLQEELGHKKSHSHYLD